jgi:Ca2+-binding RTX toxin-like protein
MPIIKNAMIYKDISIYIPPTPGLFIDGTENTDWLQGGQYADEIHGRGGNDFLYGNAGSDRLFGENGDDTLNGGAGGDLIDGGAGVDTVSYAGSTIGVTVDLTSGTTFGGDANGDTLVSIENVLGTAQGDILNGDAGANRLWASFGNDFVFGQRGNDRLEGDYGDDTMIGGEGNDILIGGFGTDRLTGDGPGVSGFDIFAFSRGHGADTIVDFASGVDDIGLMGFSGAVFGSDGKLARGTVNSDGFFRGQNFDRAAHDQIYYNTDTNELWEIKYNEYITHHWYGTDNDLKIDWSQSRVIAVFENGAEPTTQDIFMMTY